MKEILKFIPGFRTGTKWKMIVAIIYYVLSLLIVIKSLPMALFLLAVPFAILNLVEGIKSDKISAFIISCLAVIIVGASAGDIAPKILNNGASKAVNSNVTATNNGETNSPESGEASQEGTKTQNVVNGELKIHFIDVGQADSILVQQGNNFMLVDAGNNDDAKKIKSYLENQGVKELQYFVGTHAHEDHIGSADTIINSFKVGKVYFPKQTSTSQTFEDFAKAAKTKAGGLTAPNVGDTFKLGDAVCTVLAPNSEKYEDANDYSIVLKVQYGDNKFLLTGDAESVSESEMVKKGLDLKADLLKIGHHGSKSSTGANFLSAVSPKYAVVSVGKDNSYGHPVQSTLDRLKNAGVILYRTDENGTVVVTSNGKDISFNANPGSYKGAVSENTTPKSNATPQPTTTPKATTAPSAASGSKVYWLTTKTSKLYHKDPKCSSIEGKTVKSGTIQEAKADNHSEPCDKCVK